MTYNPVGELEDVREKANVVLAAAGVVFKERMNQPVVPEVIAREQSEHL